jgi:hypothetical protein
MAIGFTVCVGQVQTVIAIFGRRRLSRARCVKILASDLLPNSLNAADSRQRRPVDQNSTFGLKPPSTNWGSLEDSTFDAADSAKSW